MGDDIIAIRQEDAVTVIETSTVEIRISKSIDSITIRDIEDVLSGDTALNVEIVAIKQVDEITVIQRPAVDIRIVE